MGLQRIGKTNVKITTMILTTSGRKPNELLNIKTYCCRNAYSIPVPEIDMPLTMSVKLINEWKGEKTYIS
jgi:hypothetical protein